MQESVLEDLLSWLEVEERVCNNILSCGYQQSVSG